MPYPQYPMPPGQMPPGMMGPQQQMPPGQMPPGQMPPGMMGPQMPPGQGMPMPPPEQSMPMQAPGAANMNAPASDGGFGGAPAAAGAGAGAQLSPELVQQILAMQQQGGKSSGVARSRMLADQLRSGVDKGLQGRQSGRVITPPNLLNLAGSIGSSYMGAKMDQDAMAREEQAGKDSSYANERLFQALANNKKKPASGPYEDSGY